MTCNVYDTKRKDFRQRYMNIFYETARLGWIYGVLPLTFGTLGYAIANDPIGAQYGTLVGIALDLILLRPSILKS